MSFITYCTWLLSIFFRVKRCLSSIGVYYGKSKITECPVQLSIDIQKSWHDWWEFVRFVYITKHITLTQSYTVNGMINTETALIGMGEGTGGGNLASTWSWGNWFACKVVKTVSEVELELSSSLKSGFLRALHLQFTVELVVQYPSHGSSSSPFSKKEKAKILIGDWRWILKSNLDFNELGNSNSTSETV